MNELFNDNEMRQIINSQKGVYIFGAGKVGELIQNYLDKHNVILNGFIVSNASVNKASINGVAVFQIDDARIDREDCIIIGVLERDNKTIHNVLEKSGFKNIIGCPENILNTDVWEYKRIRTPVIEVTSKIGCSVNCRYCPQDLMVKKYLETDHNRETTMSFENFKKYIDKCPADAMIDYSGFVEPFLNRESLRMMEYTCETGRRMTLFTTLRGLDVKTAKRVVELPIDFVCLHVPDKMMYADIPMTSVYFEVLHIFLDAKKPDGRMFVDSANSQFEAHPEILKHTEGKVKIYCEMMDRAGNLDAEEVRLSHANNKGRIVCSRAINLNHNVLLPDGSLVLCCNDFGLENVLGNLNSCDYEEIMHGSKISEIKSEMNSISDSDLICRKCIFAKKVEEQ